MNFAFAKIAKNEKNELEFFCTNSEKLQLPLSFRTSFL